MSFDFDSFDAMISEVLDGYETQRAGGFGFSLQGAEIAGGWVDELSQWREAEGDSFRPALVLGDTIEPLAPARRSRSFAIWARQYCVEHGLDPDSSDLIGREHIWQWRP